MINSFAISPNNRGVRLVMGGSGIVAMATGIDTLWVQDNFMSLGTDQVVTGRKVFTQPTSFSGAFATSGATVKLVSTLNYEDGQTIMDFNPTYDAGGPTFAVYDFTAWRGLSMDFWNRKAYDNLGAVSIDWDNLTLSGYYSNVPWKALVGLNVSGRFSVSGKTPVFSEITNLNVGGRSLVNNVGWWTVDWQNGLLFANDEITMNFQSGSLYDLNLRKVLDWHNKTISGYWTATEMTVTTGRLGMMTGNYGFTRSGVVLAAGFRSAVSLLTGISGTRYEIGSGNLINRGVILVSGNGILSRLPDITTATYTGGGASYTFKMVTTGTGIISGFTTDQPIDGQPQIGLSGLNKFVTLQPYGANWYIIGQN